MENEEELDERRKEPDEERLESIANANEFLLNSIRDNFTKLGDGLLVLADDGEDAAKRFREAWWAQIKKLVVSKVFTMFANVITGGVGGGILGALGFQGGDQVTGLEYPKGAQGGVQVNDSGLYGDLHPFMLERGEVVSSREQVLTGVGAKEETKVQMAINYNPLYSSATTMEANRFASFVMKALNQRGIDISG
jgi:hypothetical protein